jgi:hypothetical protein
MINLARTFSRRSAGEQPSPVPPSPDRKADNPAVIETLERRERAVAELEAQLAVRESEVTARERRLLAAEAVLTRAASTPNSLAPSASARISDLDLSVPPRSREESRARAELAIAVGRRYGSDVLAPPAPQLDPAAQEALRLLEQRQQASQVERTQRDQRAKEQAEAGIALGHRHGSRFLVSQSDS